MFHAGLGRYNNDIRAISLNLNGRNKATHQARHLGLERSSLYLILLVLRGCQPVACLRCRVQRRRLGWEATVGPVNCAKMRLIALCSGLLAQIFCAIQIIETKSFGHCQDLLPPAVSHLPNHENISQFVSITIWVSGCGILKKNMAKTYLFRICHLLLFHICLIMKISRSSCQSPSHHSPSGSLGVEY